MLWWGVRYGGTNSLICSKNCINGVEISGETAFKCDDGIVLFSPNEGGGVDIAIIRNVIELNYNLGITDADVNLFNTEVGIMQELGGSEDGE